MPIVAKLDELRKTCLDPADRPRLHGLVAGGSRHSRPSSAADAWDAAIPAGMTGGRRAGPGSAGVVAAAIERQSSVRRLSHETLRRLEDEQREFREFLDRLRMAKDKSEFDQFMADRRNRPNPIRSRRRSPRTPALGLSRPPCLHGGRLCVVVDSLMFAFAIMEISARGGICGPRFIRSRGQR